MKISSAIHNKTVIYIFQFLFGCLLLLGLFKYQSESQFLGWSFFLSMNFWAILSLRFIIILLLSARCRMLLLQQGYQISGFHSFYLSIMGALLSIIMPAIIAFDLSRWIGIKNIRNEKNEAVKLDVLVSVGFIEKVIGFFALVFLTLIFCSFFFKGFFSLGEFFLAVSGSIFFAFIVLLSARIFSNIFKFFEWFRFSNFITKTINILIEIARHEVGLKIVFLSLSLHLCSAASFALVVSYFSGYFDFVKDMLVGLLMILTNMLPISPAGMGISEGFSLVIYNHLGDKSGFDYAINYRLIVILCHIIMFACFYMIRWKALKFSHFKD